MKKSHRLPFTIYRLPFTIIKIVIAILKIKEVGGRVWEVNLFPNSSYTIGRDKENDIVLKDRRVSRKHAQISVVGTQFKIIDGYTENGEVKRSINRVFVNGQPRYEKFLEQGDVIIIGETTLEFGKNYVEKPVSLPSSEFEVTTAQAEEKSGEQVNEPAVGQSGDVSTAVNYDDKPLGQTQLLISASEIIGKHSNISIEAESATPEEINELRRKAKVL